MSDERQTQLLNTVQEEVVQEIAWGIGGVIQAAWDKHGDDPEMGALICAAFGHALDNLDMRGSSCSAALGELLIENWEKRCGRTWRAGSSR